MNGRRRRHVIADEAQALRLAEARQGGIGSRHIAAPVGSPPLQKPPALASLVRVHPTYLTLRFAIFHRVR